MFEYFTDPVLRAPTWGCMLMCLAASLMGVLSFLNKRSLLGEGISHAAYPGVVAGMAVCAIDAADEGSLFFALVGALLFSIIGLWVIDRLEKKGKVHSDAALCFMLASFFGIGTLGASFLQGARPLMAQRVQIYLYGQAATMTDIHIVIYAALSALIVMFLVISYRPMQALCFDRVYAQSLMIVPRYLTIATFVLMLLSIVIGIRSVGVVLMSGMFVAPAVAARQWTDRLSTLLWIAAIIGVASGLLGNILSVEASQKLRIYFPHERLSLPTGPMIVLTGSAIAFLSLLFAPRRGAIPRLVRILSFRVRTVEENILKSVWKSKEISLKDCRACNHLWPPSLIFLLWRMQRQGWMTQAYRRYALTPDGDRKAARIVRLHRLWEVYLADLGWPEESVHRTAEEMEHILTPELEERLAGQLHDPKLDPHAQPIPEHDVVC
ncbi:MAG: putative metal transport system rane protein [Parachlamydiales bacterium]|nr:putative metal transport system rane protein [Parachlamydiales bacterium]